jgi:SRSO17 transposase
LELPRKSIEPMGLALRGADRNAVRAMQPFLSAGAWDDTAILQRRWSALASDLGAAEDGVLIRDGSDVPKQGIESVGVKRQYCGQLGKTANCQAGVLLASASERGYAVLDRRLYLREAWCSAEYAGRRLACGVPANATVMTKPRLGLEMIQAVLKADSLPCRWVAGDEACGDPPARLDAIDALQLWSFMAVAHDTRVGRERPATAPLPWSGRGRQPTTARLAAGEHAPLTVAVLAAELPTTAWQRATIQEGRQGPQVAEFAFQRVGAVRDGLPGPEVWLVLRRSLTDGALQTSLSNAPADIAATRLVRTRGMRWPIETCCLVGTQEPSMGDYDVRSWRGWHHHMTLVLLALAFLGRLAGRLEHTLQR